MLRFAKSLCCVALLSVGVKEAGAFALVGPFPGVTGADLYQVPVIGYQVGLDIYTPRNLSEEYRRNTPVMYYSFDANFLDYFGSSGSNAVAAAFEVYNTLQNVSSYSPELSEFPFVSQEINFTAQALSLTDLKSSTMNLIIRELGLAEPERWVWTLRDRVIVSPPGCPAGALYSVVQRNYNPVWTPLNEYQISSYVNGAYYSYTIIEICTGPNPLAEAVEFATDPAADVFTAVASPDTGFLNYGSFFTGLTRDDIGGLRYLYRTNNMNIENAGPDTVTFITNGATFLLVTSNLTDLAKLALTNDAPALQALIPGLVVASTTNFWVLDVTTNVVAYFTNLPTSVAGSPATLVTYNTYVTNVVPHFQHTFANVVTNFPVYSSGKVTTLTISPGSCPGAPAGFPCPPTTNFSTTTRPMIMGEYYIIPTNFCDINILYPIFTTVLSSTNVIITATNAVGTTNVGLQVFSRSEITYFTNHQFIAQGVVCPSNTPALRQGIEKISFVKRDLDSLLNRFFYPVTNEYTLNAITNNTLYPQKVQRVLLAPDFLLTAQDVGDQNVGNPTLPLSGVTQDITYDASLVTANYPGLAGPGTISRPGGRFGAGVQFTYSKMGPQYFNAFTPVFLTLLAPTEASQTPDVPFFAWGSFDGTTNAPIVFPNGTSITNLENSVLIQTSPSSPLTNGAVILPDGFVGVEYSTIFGGFSAIGGTPPYVWTLSPGSPGLPPGLTINPNGTITGAPDSGASGLTYDFTIRMTDAGSRFVDRAYILTIQP